ncbi:ribosomal-protein-alanine acetyltransferase [Paraphaeosphaeria minitans]|uniref:Ribosomal-protein-alanine acetyltransferase n=1 Tax=Paraphaeosphaeria minitans TaxID=565426 RepID=A0A9P6GKD3_9PLEO|nr:ribosomal-protein-alanine acetyltransferase [Paraphaeosphaeria minitans]
MVATEFHIDTPRLVISHFDSLQDSHCDFLVTLYDTEQSRDHKPVHSLMPDREAARKNIESNDLIYSTGYGRYLVSLKTPTTSATSEAEVIPFSERVKAYTKIGVVGLKFRKYEGAPLAPDVGYGLLPAFQGRGYATEAAAALVRWFEEEKGQTEFFGFCDPDNEGSKAVLRRIGFKEWGVRNIKGIYADGGLIVGMVFSKGLTKDLEAYRI